MKTYGFAAVVCVLLSSMLPSGWVISPLNGRVTSTGTMPQGMAASPDGTRIAVVESGYTPAHLAVYRARDLTRILYVRLPGALGRPVWMDDVDVLVSGANADAILAVSTRNGSVTHLRLAKNSQPVHIARVGRSRRVVVGLDGNGGELITGFPDRLSSARSYNIGGHVGDVAATNDGRRLFASDVSGSSIVAVDTATSRVTHVDTGLHPSALFLDGDRLYVAETDADTIGVFDSRSLSRLATIYVGDRISQHATGVAPNAISQAGRDILVSLGAANSVAVLRAGNVVGRVAAGRYPTDVLALGTRLYVLNGKGEGTEANPRYDAKIGGDTDYVGTIEIGSLRSIPLVPDGGNPQGASGWNVRASRTVLRPDGPIKHVFFVLKENRSYDQVLGDVPDGNGDPALTWFGKRVTPNEHALARTYGLFDQAYASGEVSAAGHMWADAAFADDYVERTWPSVYANRREDDLTGGDGPRVPSAGYIWQQAVRHHISFRDYGELVDPPPHGLTPVSADVASLKGLFDPAYVGWNLRYSDVDRAREWNREFTNFIATGNLPRFEFIWLPNDHTYGSRAGELTPPAYVAQNDYALGKIVEAISRSRVWASSVIFIIEDDAQDGPDHVSDQRTTMFVVSPYSRATVNHEHFTTMSILRSIEMLLGMPPMSTYDTMARPLYSAFGTSPAAPRFEAIAPLVDVTARNEKKSYGAAESASLDFTAPDRISGTVMRQILERNHNVKMPHALPQ